jgi:hypothetical protein
MARDLVFNRKDPVSSCISVSDTWLNCLAEVLAKLPVAMAKDACIWFDSMFPDIKLKINTSREV